MANERKNGKTPPLAGGGDFKEIPVNLPFLTLKSGNGRVFLPTNDFVSLFFKINEKQAGEIKELFENKFAVVATEQSDGLIFPIGIVSDVREVKYEKGGVRMNVAGMFRVEIERGQNADPRFIKIKAYIEAFVSDEDRQDQQFKREFENLKDLFGIFRNRINKEDESLRDAIFANNHAQKTFKLLDSLNEKNFVRDDTAIACVLDGILTIFNRIPNIDKEYADNIMNISFDVLSESDLRRRLQCVEMFLRYVVLGDEIIFNEPNGEEDKNGDDSEVITEYLNDDNKEKGYLMQEDLAKPRIKPDEIDSAPAIILKPPASAQELDWESPSAFSRQVMAFFYKRIIGQERAKKQILRVLTTLRQGLYNHEQPMIVGLFLGPTGVGKTELIKVLAEFLFGRPNAFTHIGCNTLHDKHDVDAFLTGASPGYIGYDDERVLSQWKIEQHHFRKHIRKEREKEIEALENEKEELKKKLKKNKDSKEAIKLRLQISEKLKIIAKILGREGYKPGIYHSLILFDEIERAHTRICDALLRVLDDGRLELKNGETTDLTRSLIAFTSNIYGQELLKSMTGSGKIGIRAEQTSEFSKTEFERRDWKKVLNAAEKFFSFNPAFFGRIGKENMIVCHPLTPEELMAIVDIKTIPEYKKTLKSLKGVEIFFTDEVRYFLIEETQDKTNRGYGARPLQRVFEKRIQEKINLLLEKGKDGGLVKGDKVWVEIKDGKPVFKK